MINSKNHSKCGYLALDHMIAVRHSMVGSVERTVRISIRLPVWSSVTVSVWSSVQDYMDELMEELNND